MITLAERKADTAPATETAELTPRVEEEVAEIVERRGRD